MGRPPHSWVRIALMGILALFAGALCSPGALSQFGSQDVTTHVWKCNRCRAEIGRSMIATPPHEMHCPKCGLTYIDGRVDMTAPGRGTPSRPSAPPGSFVASTPFGLPSATVSRPSEPAPPPPVPVYVPEEPEKPTSFKKPVDYSTLYLVLIVLGAIAAIFVVAGVTAFFVMKSAAAKRERDGGRRLPRRRYAD
jgi:DNA-directed RNA polymerase subunit RPC12/RpoP